MDGRPDRSLLGVSDAARSATTLHGLSDGVARTDHGQRRFGSLRERAFLTLISTTGLRSCAIGHARLSDVWQEGAVPTTLRFVEKNAQIRTMTQATTTLYVAVVVARGVQH